MTDQQTWNDSRTDEATPTDGKTPVISSSTEAAKVLLQLVARDARGTIIENRRRGLGEGASPHVNYLAKVDQPGDGVADYERAKKAAAEQYRIQAQHRQPYGTQFLKLDRAHYENKVFRVWVPFNPNENPHVDGNIRIPAKHHKSRQAVERMVEDQIVATDETFATMRSLDSNFPTAANLGSSALALERQALTVKALRLKGVEVTQYAQQFERIEVYFENPELKMRVPEDEDLRIWRESEGRTGTPVSAAYSERSSEEAVGES